MTRRSNRRDRRTVLRGLAVGAVGLTGLAGCLESGDDGRGDDNPFAEDGDGDGGGGGDGGESSDGGGTDGGDGGGGSDGPDESTGSDGGDVGDLEIGIVEDGGALGSHSAVQDLAGQPYFGPPPGEGAGTVVAFEDTSCSRCASFEQGTVEKIRTELAASGDATFVFRGYPILYPSTSEPACKVLEATLARSPRAHFAMTREYFVNQNEYSADNVYDRSETRLNELTDLDGAAVVADARDGAFDDAVATDVAAGEAADASVTPAVYVFRDGEFRTKASGSLSFEAVETALGL